LQCTGTHRNLHSFPTRRSSDLKKEYIEKLKQHQLARVLRVDKFTLAGLEATLKSYIRGQETKEIPTVRDIVQHKEVVLEKAQRLDRKSTRLNSSHVSISYAVFC